MGSEVDLLVRQVAKAHGKVLQVAEDDVLNWSFTNNIDGTLNINITFKPGKRAQWVTPDGSAE